MKKQKQKVEANISDIGDQIDGVPIDNLLAILGKFKETYTEYELFVKLDYEQYSDDRTLFIYGKRDETDDEQKKRLEEEKEWEKRHKERDERMFKELKEKLGK